MAVVEYMNHVYMGDHRRHIPGFIHDRAHWYNPEDETFVGWVKSKTDYYVPNTLKQLTKEDFVQRCFRIHAVEPIMVFDENSGIPGMGMTALTTEDEVRAHAEKWYDDFVAKNLAEEAAGN
jgi:hypothetical protein